MTSDCKRACGHAVVIAFIGISAWIAFSPQGAAQSSTSPQYDANHQLLVPVGFEKWIFVGSNLGLAYKPDLPATTKREASRADKPKFHNVYISAEAYTQFLTTKKFPETTMLVMEIFEAADKEPKDVLASGVFNGQRAGLEVAVKNSHRPDGSATPWAYYDFTDPADPSKLRASAPAFPDRSCENCHRQHASMDNVWVQFYPTLRKAVE